MGQTHGCNVKRLQHMKRLLVAAIASLTLGAIPAVAGVPQSESINEGKWQKVDENWLIDTQDVEVKRDQIRFWVERMATGEEIGSTQAYTSWKGKLRVRCSDFNSRIDPEGINGYGMPIIMRGRWSKIKPSSFAYQLASNFCYLTKTPGYTPEPIEYTWQRILTAEIKKQLTPEAVRRREQIDSKRTSHGGICTGQKMDFCW